MPQGVGRGGNYLAPGKVLSAGDLVPLNSGLLTENPIRFPDASTLYVRKTGSDNNGGSSVSTSPDATGTDGVTDGTAIFTAASGAFSGAYVDELINIVGVGRFRIEEVIGATTLRLSASTGAAVAGSGKTWNVGGAVLTIAALLANGNGAVREGDTIWVGSGIYRGRIVIPAMVRNGGPSSISVKGDVDGAVTGDFGQVQITIYEVNDKTAPSADKVALLEMSGGVSFLTFLNILFVGAGLSTALDGVAYVNTDPAQRNQGGRGAPSQQIAFTDCAFIGSKGNGVGFSLVSRYGYPQSWTFDRCFFQHGSSGRMVRIWEEMAVAGDEYDLAFVMRNCIVITNTNSGVVDVSPVSSFAGSTARAAGGRIANCTFFAGSGGVLTIVPGAGRFSITVPFVFDNNLVHSSDQTVLSATTTGMIVEDYNIMPSGIARTNVAVGAHSLTDTSYSSSLLHMGQERIWGALLRQFGEPMDGSPLLGYGNDGSQTAYDLRNGSRPAGGSSVLPAVGALERSNTFAKETGTVHTGSNAISATGPAYQDFLVPVASGTSYTISVYVAYDGSYTGTAPQIKLVNGTEAGVTDQTVAAGGSAGGGFVQVSLALFTPTSNGFVTVRVQSNDTSGVSETVFDSFAVA